MFQIIPLPSNTKSITNNPAIEEKLNANNFVKRKTWIVDILMGQFKLWRYYSRQDLKEIRNNCLIKLWLAYKQKKDQPDGYYFIAINRYITNLRSREKNNTESKKALDTVDIEKTENIVHYCNTQYSGIAQKMFIENLERRLSEKAKKLLIDILFTDFALNTSKKKTNCLYHHRKKIFELGYTKDDIKNFEAEYKSAINSPHSNQTNNENRISNLVAEEIY